MSVDHANAKEFLDLAARCERQSTGHGHSADRETLMEAAIAIRALTTVLVQDDAVSAPVRQPAPSAAAAPDETQVPLVASATAVESSIEPLSPTDPNLPHDGETETVADLAAVAPAATLATTEAAPSKKGPQAKGRLR